MQDLRIAIAGYGAIGRAVAALSLAGIELDGDAARLEVQIENVPSENPKTGRITARSVLALLRKQRAPLAIGT